MRIFGVFLLFLFACSTLTVGADNQSAGVNGTVSESPAASRGDALFLGLSAFAVGALLTLFMLKKSASLG